MRQERRITLEGKEYTVVISDEQEALLAAEAAGRAIIGLWNREKPDRSLKPAVYLVEELKDVNDMLLEQVVRRREGMPWIIGETDRLMIREFCLSDIPKVLPEAGDGPEDEIFYREDKLKDYIRCQYGFYEYGIWALEEKSSGELIGKAGVTVMNQEELPDGEEGLELGYHIFLPYRRQGYGREACLEILKYVRTHHKCSLYAKIDPSNEVSIQLAESCGFRFMKQICNEAGRKYSLYVGCCPQSPEG